MATAKKEAAKKAAPAASGTSTAKKSFFYVLYVDTYRDEKTIVPRGIYRTKAKIERFEKLANKYVEKFEGKIPDPKIFKLAQELRVTVTDEAGDYLDSKVILEELVQDLD